MKRNKVLNKIGVIFVTCLLISLSSQIAIAATYFIDYASGSDSNNGSSTATPWKHAPGMSGWTGTATLSNGDTVILKGGVTWLYSGVQDIWTLPANITVQGGQRLGTPWGTGYPVIASDGATGSVKGIVVGNRSNVAIDGIKIYNTENSPSGGSGIALGVVNNVEIKNCVFDHTGDQSIVGVGDGSRHILIHDNSFSNVGRLFIAVSDKTNVDDIQIYNNTFMGTGTWPGGLVGGVHGDGIMIGSACTAANTCLTNLKIYNNIFKGNWKSGATALIFLQNGTAPGSTQYGGNHVQIYNNQLAIDSDGVISPGFIEIWALWNDVKIYNNTFGGYTGGENPTSSCIFVQTDSTNVDVKNNIFSGCVNGITGPMGSGKVDADYNLYYPTGGAINRYINGTLDCRSIADCRAGGQEAHGKEGDPKFVTLPTGSNSGNWRIQESSPATSGGVNLGSPYTTDLNGVVGTNRMGAYQYASGGITSYKLTVNKVGSGKVTGGNIDCGNACFNSGTSDTPVTLRAVADTGYTFTGWSDGNCSGTDDCIVTLTGDTSVTAIFTATAAPVAGSSGDGGGGGGGGCFIATAAYGSYLDPHVMVLREFRDKVLLKTKLGQQFVKFYYKHSPSVADSISKVEALKFATRLALTPVVYSLAYPNIALMLLLIAFLILMVARRRKIYKLEHACENTFFQTALGKR